MPAHLGSGEGVRITPFPLLLRSQGGTVVMVSQFPLVPAYALTIHKAQGLTLQQAAVDPRDSFNPALLYVALSRVTSLAGLTLLEYIKRVDIKPRPDVDAEMRRLRGIGLTRIVPIVPPKRGAKRPASAPPSGRAEASSSSTAVPVPVRVPKPVPTFAKPAAKAAAAVPAKPAPKPAPKPGKKPVSTGQADNLKQPKTVPIAELARQLSNFGLDLDLETPGGGNCLFHAIARTANREIPGCQIDAAWLREHIFDSVTDAELEVADLGEETPAEYRARLKEDRTWAGELEMKLCARLLNVPIIVWGYSVPNRARLYHPSGEEQDGLQSLTGVVIAFNGADHFMGTLPVDPFDYTRR